jgi:CRP/FNR family transcriptional regulator
MKLDISQILVSIFDIEEKNLLTFIQQNGIIQNFAKNDVIIEAGSKVSFVPIIIRGSLRIMLVNDNGDEYFLYHIYQGETCSVSLACCLAHSMSDIKAVAEEDTTILMIPLEFVDTLESFKSWKRFVASNQSHRFSELLETIELIAFSKLDDQLWSYLLKRAQAQGVSSLSITHQEIANEMHSPREVISRLLHQLQKKGMISLSRNQITINSDHFIL